MSNQQTPLGVALRHLAEAQPAAPAITTDNVSMSRDELERRTNRLARAFSQMGVAQGALVTIALPNSSAFYEAAIASWKLGAIPQPVSYRLPPRELAALVQLADPALVFGLDPGEGRAWLPADFEPDPSLADNPLPPLISPSWKAPTSGGSTGRPKLILAGKPGTFEEVIGSAARVHLEREGTILCTAPLYHNAPFMYSLLGLLLGNHIVLMRRFDAAQALELVERYRVTWMYVVPTMMHRILRLPEAERTGRDLSSLHTALHVGAPCPPEVKRAWIEWLGPEKIYEIYAGTEAQAVSAITGQEWLEHPGSVGRVIFGEMRVLGLRGEELPVGEVGEVWMRPPQGVTTYRYLGAKPKLHDGWESLGDMGSFDADGYLYLADRQTDMILCGGANIYPAEVEAALLEHPQVISACVIGLPDEEYGNIVHAIVQTKEVIGDELLRAYLAERLAPYKIPRSFERTEEALRDDAGKIRRSALRQERIQRR